MAVLVASVPAASTNQDVTQLAALGGCAYDSIALVVLLFSHSS